MGQGPRSEAARRVDGFDGLRACAALLVIVYHAGLVTGASSTGPLAAVVAQLNASVAVFFVISGFVLYLPAARAIRGSGPPQNWPRYAARRAARILPGYWVALTLLLLAGQVPAVAGPDWWRFYGLAQIYQGRTLLRGLGPAWSLSVEVSFYAALPLLAIGMGRLVVRRPRAAGFRAQLMIIGGLALGSLALRGLLTGSLARPIPLGHFSLATSLAGTADWFAAGMALAIVRAEWESGSSAAGWLRKLAAHPGRCWLLAAVAYLVGVPLQHGPQFLPLYGVATHLAIALAAALFVLPAVLPAQPVRRISPMGLLRSKPLAWLGTVSYGIYLWHLPFLQTMDRLLGRPRGPLAFGGMFVLTAVGAVCLGAASWYLVERPTQSWVRRRLSARNLQRGVTAAGSIGPAPLDL